MSHKARATLGDRLAAVGDRREGVGLRDDDIPDIDWRMIEGGEIVTLESDQTNSRAFQNVDSFWMARYPVTISQFEAFVQDCFREGAWHLPDGVPSTGLEEPSERSAKARNEPVTKTSPGMRPLPSVTG